MVLKNGSSGDDVKALQEGLALLGFDAGTADGIFGAKTAAALQAFQASKNLDADGIFGPNTQSSFDLAVAAAKGKAAREAREAVADPGRGGIIE